MHFTLKEGLSPQSFDHELEPYRSRTSLETRYWMKTMEHIESTYGNLNAGGCCTSFYTEYELITP